MWLQSASETVSMGKNTTADRVVRMNRAQASLESTDTKITKRTCPTAGRIAGVTLPVPQGRALSELRNPF